MGGLTWYFFKIAAEKCFGVSADTNMEHPCLRLKIADSKSVDAEGEALTSNTSATIAQMTPNLSNELKAKLLTLPQCLISN